MTKLKRKTEYRENFMKGIRRGVELFEIPFKELFFKFLKTSIHKFLDTIGVYF